VVVEELLDLEDGVNGFGGEVAADGTAEVGRGVVGVEDGDVDLVAAGAVVVEDEGVRSTVARRQEFV